MVARRRVDAESLRSRSQVESLRSRYQADEGRSLQAALRRAAGQRRFMVTAPPRPINARGSVLRVELGGPDGSLIGPAIVRDCGDLVGTAREGAVQAFLHDRDYPTPAVLLAGDADDELGGTWLLTEHVDGPAIRIRGGRNPLHAVKSLWALWQRPALLADLLARLHRIDTEPLERTIAAGGLGFDWYTYQTDLVRRLGGSAKDRLLEWLEANRPAETVSAVSHGDLHPGNIVIGPDGPQVIDWGIATLAPPARDVACTMFALTNAGGQAPGPVRPAVALLGRVLSARFLRLYRRRAAWALPDDELDWHRVLYAASRIFWAARADRRGRPANEGDELTARASRAEGVLGQELAIHSRLINDVTGIAVDTDRVGDIEPID